MAELVQILKVRKRNNSKHTQQFTTENKAQANENLSENIIKLETETQKSNAKFDPKKKKKISKATAYYLVKASTEMQQ